MSVLFERPNSHCEFNVLQYAAPLRKSDNAMKIVVFVELTLLFKK